MVEKFEYFKKGFVVIGKHSRLVDDMWEQGQIHNSYFKRLVDLYTIAPIIGLRMKRTADEDHIEEGRRNIQLEQIMTRLEDLNTIMKMVLLLDETSCLTAEQRVDRTFRNPDTKEQFDANVELFNSYVRGGIEVLHELLVQRALSIEDEYTEVKVGNIVALLDNPLVPDI